MFNIPKTPSTPEIRFGADGKYPLDGGINLLRQETALPMNQASDVLNETADDRGTLSKRKGQALLDTSLGSGGCTSIIYKGKIIKQWSTFLYKYDLDGTNPVLLYSGMATSKAFFIVFQGLLYIFNGTEPLQYDGTTVSTLISNAYVPIVSQGRKFDGSVSTLYEPLNLLTGQFTDMFSPLAPEEFTDTFSPDGTNKIFTLSNTNLDATLVKSNNGTIEGTGFTVNRVTGTVTFTTAPTAGVGTLRITGYKTPSKIYTLSFKGLDAATVTCNNGTTEGTGFTVDRVNGTVTFTTTPTPGTNTLKITASKTNANDSLQIKNCTRAIEFSSRLFLTGNVNYPNRLWKTGLTPNQSTIQANYYPC